MRAVHLFLRARAVINFLMRAASTLEITNGKQRALRKFIASWNLSLLKCCFAPSNLADNFKQDNRRKARQHHTIPHCVSIIPSSLQPIMPCLICRLLQNYSTKLLHKSQLVYVKRDLKLSETLFYKQVGSLSRGLDSPPLRAKFFR